jgi:DNA-binding XRE family transcriptional regulator
MKLQTIERKIQKLREAQEVPFILLQERGLYPVSVYHIERGENYTFDTLLKYLTILNAHLLINETEVTDLLEAGAAFRALRVEQGWSLASLGMATKLSARTIINIEKGRGYTKKNLIKYLSKVHVDFGIKSLI